MSSSFGSFPFRSGVKILTCRLGLATNRAELLPRWPGPIEVPSLLTDFHEVREIPWPEEKADGYILIEDVPDIKPQYEIKGINWLFRGPFLNLSQETSDRRYSFWGNQGFLYRLVLALLEKNHGIYSLHACGLVDEEKNRLIAVAGGAGSGKTVYLLSGLLQGLKLFSTETVHFRLEGTEVRWFMGSLVDNIRLGTLRHDFPAFLTSELKGMEKTENEWQVKVAVDLSAYRISSTSLLSPECILIFPRVEEGRPGFLLSEIKDRRKAMRAIFANISEKIAASFILYDILPLVSLDTAELAERRLEAVSRLLSHPSVRTPVEIVTNPRECWGDILEQKSLFR